jgi:hypothetical protein
MIHPNTELKFISQEIGYGVFATAFIPTGTIVYVVDPLELVVSQDDFCRYPDVMKMVIEKFSYIDSNGNKIVSWDHAKYVNHCCNCNTMSSGYGFEIAIRDIHAGEEITDEYGLFNMDYELELTCSLKSCRKTLKKNDLDNYFREWDNKVHPAILKISSVEQPLYSLLEESTRTELEALKTNPDLYKSVFTLKYH